VLSTSQSSYASCNDVVSAYAGGSLAGIVGIYVSTAGGPTTTIDCSSDPCVRTAPTCYSTWDDSAAAPTGTAANLTNNTTYQYCTYIDTANFNGLSPSITAGGAASSSWSGSIPTIATGGVGANVIFDASTNWIDALP